MTPDANGEDSAQKYNQMYHLKYFQLIYTTVAKSDKAAGLPYRMYSTIPDALVLILK